MKNSFLAMAMIAFACSITYSQTHSLTPEVHSDHREEVIPLIEVHVDGPVKGKFGWIASGLLSRHGSEAYGGLTYSPQKGVKLSASAGVETNKHDQSAVSAIGVISLKLEKAQWSFVHDSQIGDSGYKTRNTLKRYLSSGVSIGAYGEKGFGVGPYVEKKFGEHFALFWVMGFGYRPKCILGVKYNFDFK